MSPALGAVSLTWALTCLTFAIPKAKACCSCNNLMPFGHSEKAVPQDIPSPFLIEVKNGTYARHQKVIVTLKATGGYTFRSFFLGAYKQGWKPGDNVVGSLTEEKDQKAPRRAEPNCIPVVTGLHTTSNAVVSTDMDPKTMLQFHWAPETFNDTVEFRASYIVNDTVYWVAEKSEPLYPASMPREEKSQKRRPIAQVDDSTSAKDSVPPPRIEIIGPTRAKADLPVRLECRVTGHPPPLSISWHRGFTMTEDIDPPVWDGRDNATKTMIYERWYGLDKNEEIFVCRAGRTLAASVRVTFLGRFDDVEEESDDPQDPPKVVVATTGEAVTLPCSLFNPDRRMISWRGSPFQNIRFRDLQYFPYPRAFDISTSQARHQKNITETNLTIRKVNSSFHLFYHCANHSFGDYSECRYREDQVDGVRCFQLFVNDPPRTQQTDEEKMTLRVREGTTAFLPCASTFDNSTKVARLSKDPGNPPQTLFIGERRIISDLRTSVEQSRPGQWDLLIRNVTPEDAGTYVFSSDNDGPGNKTVQLKIVPRVSFAAVNTTVQGHRGDTVRLFCAVRHLDSRLIVWRTNESELLFVNGFYRSNYGHYRAEVRQRHGGDPSVTVSILTIYDLRLTDAGHFICEVGYYRHIMEQVFTVIVVVPVPTIYFYFANDTLPTEERDNTTLQCASYLGYNQEILWRLPDSPIGTGNLTSSPESVVIERLPSYWAVIASSLTIRDFSALRLGPYSCRVLSRESLADQNFVVEEEVPKGSFIVGETTVRVELGGSATLSCSVRDLGSKQIGWFNGDYSLGRPHRRQIELYTVQVSTSNDSRITVSNLTIHDVTPIRAGVYICYVGRQDHPIGQAFSLIAQVPPPYLVPLNTTYRVEEGSDVILPCAVRHLYSPRSGEAEFDVYGPKEDRATVPPAVPSQILWSTPYTAVASGDQVLAPEYSVKVGTRIHWTTTVSDLTIRNLTLSRTGRYICRVNSQSTTTDLEQNFTVVPEVPSMVGRGSDRTVKKEEGGTASFLCEIRNVFSRVLLWRRPNSSSPVAIDDYVFPDADKYSVRVERSRSDPAVTMYWLTISNITGSDAGDYICQVVYDGTTVEQFFTLDVPVPSLVSSNPNVEAEEGSNATLTCAVRSQESRKIMWRRPNSRSPIAIGDNIFVDNPKFSVLVDKTSVDRSLTVSILTISDLSVAMTGDYICQVLYQQQPIEQRVTVNVPSPSFVVDPTTAQTEEGASVTLSCAVRNLDSGVISWRRPNSTRPIAVGAYVFIYDSKYSVAVDKSVKDRSVTVSSLTISDITGPKAGDYICEVLYKQKTLEQVFTVNVPIPFFDVVDSTSVQAEEGASATLACAVRNLDSGVIVWRRPNSPSPIAVGDYVFFDDLRYSVTVENPASDRFVSKLTISDLSGSHIGDYICQVLYQKRSIQQRFTVNTEGQSKGKAPAPSTPAPSPARFKSLSLRAVALSSDTVLVTAIGPRKLKNVVIRYRDVSGVWSTATYEHNEQRSLVTDLQPNTRYVFMVRARDNGKHMRANTHATTRARNGLPAVQNVYIETDDVSHSAQVSWQYVGRGQVVGFVLNFEQSHNGEFQHFKTVTVFNSTSATIDGLQQNIDYIVKIAPFDDNRVGIESSAFSFQIFKKEHLQ